ncbi:L,D-transpeptidase family protein [Sorangium sp. So ce131]|uniref:L,D-transpeptidase n=1 Tax=Sorangium sp. So ce131 TaxID=3133282 RepID=UPI003F5EDD95
MNRSQAPRPHGQKDLARSQRTQTSGNVRTGDARKPHPAPDAGRPGGGATRASLVSSALGFVAAAAFAGAAAWASGCQGEAPPGPSTEGHPPERTTSLPRPAPTTSARATAPVEAPRSAPTSSAEPEPPLPDKPYTGPLLGSIVPQAAVYPTTEFSKERLGYIRLGGKVPVDPKPIKAGSCAKGWYRLLDGGYVCGRSATTDMSNPQVRLGITAPKLDDVLPYKYAFNTTHGTPLYRSVPSKDEMARYEPYLESSKRKKKEEEKKRAEELYEETEKEVAAAAAARGAGGGEAGASPAPVDGQAPAPAMTAVVGDAAAAGDKAAAVAAAASLGILTPAPAEEEPEKPWWENVDEKGRPLNVTLADLDKDADGTVAKRMVKGFFVAVDKTFGWNGRSWYKTTAGLVAPSDRMYIIKPPTSQGIDFPEGAKSVGFILAKSASKYQFDAEMKSVSVAGSLERFAAFGLTGESHNHKATVYRKTTEGWWMKGADGTYTDIGAPPPDLAPGEKWIDVNLSRKTIVAIEGDKPVYAALISPGRRSKDKKKDHPTHTGVFRIREKHIATTMDGDGTVAGDLPYSIEDVPYVAYYDGSYALHGAFWHSNFGREMSHGCVNLSPLDAKKLFFWSEPRLPRGWHGVWATSENRGTLVSIHE